MRYIWSPLARKTGVKEEREVVRFAEQGWGLSIYLVSWSLGLVSHSLLRHTLEVGGSGARP